MKTPLITLLSLLVFLISSLAAKQPNVVIILADDLGYGDLGCYGHPQIKTPNLDRMAAEGAKMTQFNCPAPFCAPTRAALMSGQYAPRTGVYTVGGIDRFDWSTRTLRPVDNVTELPLDRDIIAKQLKAGGYATGMFGKWHLNSGAGTNVTPRTIDGWPHFAGTIIGALPDYSAWTKITNGVSAATTTYATTDTINDTLFWIAARGSSPP